MDLQTSLRYVAPLIGVFTIIIGAAAVLKPQAMSEKFGIAVKGEALPYVVSTGIRDVFIGLSFLILYYLELWTAIGACSLCVGMVALSDFLVVRKHGDKRVSWVHMAGAIAVVGYGVWALGLGQSF